eukprot:CAMPEP_0198151822 /NCGR_PEP_ID=MMETSP1443-20131203/57269_1 /TAXON_ID=186043 /ORGANISM="Entomoneis sp., Strain CCMP2396" /LENGTH=216 /DNA_ID=CAMNT_0043817639 /DNA_START=90 /DNA_END=740 /DNA_ORIENTATION=-
MSGSIGHFNRYSVHGQGVRNIGEIVSSTKTIGHSDRQQSFIGTEFDCLFHPEKHLEERPVEFLHHDSPVGPAVSVFPRGYTKKPECYGASTFDAEVVQDQRSSPRTVAGGLQISHVQERKVSMIEISPGIRARLRGAAETRDCIGRDFFMPSLCNSCSLEMFCIQDAAYVLCPQCRVVNPISDVDEDFCEGGLGMGFTIEDLGNIRSDLERERLGL